MVAVMRKMTNVIYSVWTNNKPFIGYTNQPKPRPEAGLSYPQIGVDGDIISCAM